MIHALKIWPQYFERIYQGEKKFEVRVNDRDYQVGDILDLNEYDPTTKSFTGRSLPRRVGYILHGGQFGIDSNVVVMSLDNAHE